VREQWDCETIVSTYSTTENLPAIIGAPRRGQRVQIELSAATGVAVGALRPKVDAAASSKEDVAGFASAQGVEKDEEDEEDDEDDAPRVNQGAARPKRESSDARRARKEAVKAARRNNRARKKALKVLFKREAAAQERATVRQAAPGASVHRIA
jgi:protein LTV1